MDRSSTAPMARTQSIDAGRRQLTSWPLFLTHLSKGERDARTQAVFDFHARWRFAESFEGIDVVGYAPRGEVVEGYRAMLQVMLACTAREQLAVVLGVPDHKSLQIQDVALADRLRAELYGDGTTPFAKALDRIDDARNRALNRVWERKSHDVHAVAFLVRHGVAHGSFTPTGIGLKGPSIKVLDDLSRAVQADSDKRFTTWMKAQLKEK